MDGDAYQANYQRGVILRGQRRYQESREFLVKAIALDPERGVAYAELALCLTDWTGRSQQALEAIDRAIALEPANAHFVGSRDGCWFKRANFPLPSRRPTGRSRWIHFA